MENNIQLNSDFHSNSYLKHFKVALFNLRLLTKEEPTFKKRFKKKGQSQKA